MPDKAQVPPYSVVDTPLLLAKAASEQRFKLLPNITSDLIDFPFGLHLFFRPTYRLDEYAAANGARNEYSRVPNDSSSKVQMSWADALPR